MATAFWSAGHHDFAYAYAEALCAESFIAVR